MVEQSPFGPQDPDFTSHNDGYNQNLGATRKRSYVFGRSAKDDSVPLFLSDPDGEPEPSEYDYDFEESEAPPRRMSVSLKILMAVVAAAGVAMIFAMATSDATRDVIVSAKASISGMQPVAVDAAQAEAAPSQPSAAKLTASDVQAKDPARWSAYAAPQAATTARGPVVAMAPTREDVSSAYQNAVQDRAAPPPPAAVATPPSAAAPVVATPAVTAPASARVIDDAELALLMKRAKEMLISGDIPAARLLLRRAADGRDSTAALMLAQTYDPDVLGTQDIRNITPDPETARVWYQKAAQLGSAAAQRRLAQMQN
jgi:hypothetical protein